MSYSLSPTGRRNALVVLLGAIVVWVFACWALRTTLSTLQVQLVFNQVIPALLMVGLVVATPLIFWQLLAEYAAVYTINQQGLHYDSLGVALAMPWETIEPIIPDDQAISYSFRLTNDVSSQIANPFLRFLHIQSSGRKTLSIPAGVDRQAELIAAITAYCRPSTVENTEGRANQTEQEL